MPPRLLVLAAAIPLVGVTLAVPSAVSAGAATSPSPGIAGITRTITAGPAVAFPRSTPGSAAPTTHEVSTATPAEHSPKGGGAASARIAAPAAATPSASVIVRTGSELKASFDGINHYDSRTADGGNAFSGEPPDQALCVGGGKVVEGVNNAVQVYERNGTKHGVSSLNSFYGFAPAFIRPAGPFGPTLFDPTCVYDPQTGTFFMVVDDLGTDPATGGLTGQGLLDIAVTKDPLGTWQIYQLDVTDDGRNGTPVHAGCPCFGDYPHIGFDRNGFYISTNEFSLIGPEFDGAQVYAFSKQELANAAATIHVTQFDTTGADQGNGGFTVWPAQSPSGADFDRSAGGTAHFLSSNAVFTDAGVSDTLVTWSMTGTSTLNRQHPTARLRDSRVGVQTYSVPDPVTQKPGPTPLLDCLNTPSCRPSVISGKGPKEVLQQLDSNDTRIQQVSYVGGKLYGALDTKVAVGGATQAGIAWYVLAPGDDGYAAGASVVNQGQFGLAGNDLTYPALAVTKSGRGVMAYTLAGPGYYPSAAYSTFTAEGMGPIKVAALGKGPQDGFAGYEAFNAPSPKRPRWGDYGAASVDGSSVWIASEYIGQSCTLAQYVATPFGTCGGTRTALANWGTRISNVRP